MGQARHPLRSPLSSVLCSVMPPRVPYITINATGRFETQSFERCPNMKLCQSFLLVAWSLLVSAEPPSPQYGSPSPQYGSPSPQYGSPSPQYGSPSPQYGSPSPQYGSPPGQRGLPSSQYGSLSLRPSYKPSGQGYGKSYGANDDSETANYEFKYDVDAPEYGTKFGHQEARQGDVATGRYYVLLPDGRTQLVEYTADQDGYHPKVTYQGGSNGNGGYGRGQSGNGYKR